MRINTQVICNMPTGTPVYGFRLTNSIGAVVELTNWGARWLSAIVPDKHGEMANVYRQPDRPVVGRVLHGSHRGPFCQPHRRRTPLHRRANLRTGKNDGQNTNHGGFSGFDRMLWDWEVLDDGVRFTRLSPMEKAVIRATHTSRWNTVGTTATSCPSATMEQQTGQPT